MDQDANGGVAAPQVYTLTALVRGAGATRRVVVASFDLPLRGAVITACALVASIPPTAIAWAIVGKVALVVPVFLVAAAFYLVEARSRSGLRLRNYQQMVDKRRAGIGQFVCYGKPVDPAPRGWARIVASSMPSPYLDGQGEPSAFVLGRASESERETAPTDLPRVVQVRSTDRIAWE